MLLIHQCQRLFHNYSDSRCESTINTVQKSCIKVCSLKLNLFCDFVVGCKITMAHLENGTSISNRQVHTLLLNARR